MAVVRVYGNDVLAACSRYATAQSVTISFILHADQPCSHLAGNSRGAVRAAVIGHYDFAVDPVFAKYPLYLADAIGQSLGLVEAWNDNG